MQLAEEILVERHHARVVVRIGARRRVAGVFAASTRSFASRPIASMRSRYGPASRRGYSIRAIISAAIGEVGVGAEGREGEAANQLLFDHRIAAHRIAQLARTGISPHSRSSADDVQLVERRNHEVGVERRPVVRVRDRDRMKAGRLCRLQAPRRVFDGDALGGLEGDRTEGLGQQRQRPLVGVGRGLADGRVFGGHDRLEARRQPFAIEHATDLDAERAGRDGERHQGGGATNRGFGAREEDRASCSSRSIVRPWISRARQCDRPSTTVRGRPPAP